MKMHYGYCGLTAGRRVMKNGGVKQAGDCFLPVMIPDGFLKIKSLSRVFSRYA